MQTLQHPYSPVYTPSIKTASVLSRFISWCKSQEKYRLGWLAIIIIIHGCILTPVTVSAIVLSGNNFLLWGVAIGAMTMALVVNLAAMPTKVTIPIFFFSILLDLVAIVSALASIA
jgi:hypothetical protein